MLQDSRLSIEDLNALREGGAVLPFQPAYRANCTPEPDDFVALSDLEASLHGNLNLIPLQRFKKPPDGVEARTGFRLVGLLLRTTG